MALRHLKEVIDMMAVDKKVRAEAWEEGKAAVIRCLRTPREGCMCGEKNAVNIGKLTNPYSAPDGTCAAPSISLRDWFAGQVLPSVTLDYYRECCPSGGHPEAGIDVIAKNAYEIADEMLKARLA